jgi:hypothetical protein
MAPWSKLVYYLDGFWTPAPLVKDEELFPYAQAHGVDYLVKEAVSVKEIQSLHNQGPPPGFEPMGILRSVRFDYALGFYRVQREIRQ